MFHTKFRRVVSAVPLVFFLVLLIVACRVTAAEMKEVTDFGSNPGNLRMYKFVPDSASVNSPLILVLHGCKQQATDFAQAAGWVQLAERWGWLLLLPQQQESNNPWGCFNWFLPEDTARNQGEVLSIRQMIDALRKDRAIDAQHTFIVGLSAGGAMTAVMLATYPEEFAGGAIVAGIPFGCARDVKSAFQCQSPGGDFTPAEWGDRVRAASLAEATKQWPKVSIWQGDNDALVHPVNGRELVEQWTDVHQIDPQAGVKDTLKGISHTAYRDKNGVAQVEIYQVPGMSHGYPIDPGGAIDQCGTAAPYVLAVGICSSYYIATFWGIVPKDHAASR